MRIAERKKEDRRQRTDVRRQRTENRMRNGEFGMGSLECGMGKEKKRQSFEFGLRPVGAYAPEGRRNLDCGLNNWLIKLIG